MPTFKEVRAKLATIGVRISRTTLEGDASPEYRVCKKGQGEDAAYYTNDLQDALDTGRRL